MADATMEDATMEDATEELAATFKKLGLTAPEHHEARQCFVKLINKGCELTQLGSLLLLWKLGNDEPRITETNHAIHIRPMDDWQTALGRFTREDLKDLQGTIKKKAQGLRDLKTTADELYGTRLLKHSLLDSKFGTARPLLQLPDLIAVADHLDAYADRILPVLIDACSEIGPKRSPDRTRIEGRICDYVHQTTGENHYFYEDIATIFAALDPDIAPTAEALKQRYYRKKVTENR